MIAFLLSARLKNAASCAVAGRHCLCHWCCGMLRGACRSCLVLLNLFSPKQAKALKFLWNTKFWGTLRCGRLGWAARVGNRFYKIRSSSWVFVLFLNAFKLPGLGSEGSTGFRAVLQDCGHRFLSPSQHMSYAVICSDVQWSQVPLHSSVGSAERLCTGCCYFSLAGYICLSLLHSTGNLEGIPCLLFPSSFSCTCFLSCNMWDRSFLWSHGLGTAPEQRPCLCVLLFILERRGKLSHVGQGPFPAAAGLQTQEVCAAKPLYGTFAKHALTVCKCTVFKQQSLYYQMQSCRL